MPKPIMLTKIVRKMTPRGDLALLGMAAGRRASRFQTTAQERNRRVHLGWQIQRIPSVADGALGNAGLFPPKSAGPRRGRPAANFALRRWPPARAKVGDSLRRDQHRKQVTQFVLDIRGVAHRLRDLGFDGFAETLTQRWIATLPRLRSREGCARCRLGKVRRFRR
jgi:hypothetical protein